MVGTDYGRVNGWYPVNEVMIGAWCDALGLDSAAYLDPAVSGRNDAVAPPTMLQVWTMVDSHGERGPGSVDSNFYEVLDILTEAGFPGVVAVNCEQEYDRYPRVGDTLSFTSRIESVSTEKDTALGPGVFIEQVRQFVDQDGARVATMRFRLLKFRPANKRPAPPQPGISQDTQFFWDGLAEGKLLIQRCGDCGRLRHPPGPACPACHSFGWDSVQSTGLGTIHSFIVAHHPKAPAFPDANPIALVDLEEGTRVVAQLVGIAPEDVAIGARVELVIETRPDAVPLPRFRPRC